MTDPAADRVIDLYQRHGTAWARLRRDDLCEGAWLDRFAALLPAGSAVLDIGCGSGVPIARALIRRGVDVTGLDAAPTMVALFRRNLPGTPVVLGDMRRLALGRRFAGMLAWDSFFHLTPAEQRAMFPRFRDHAAPGAAPMFTTGTVEGRSMGMLADAPLYHGSLDTAEYRMLLDTMGFDVIAHVVADPDCGDHTVWLARRRP